MEFSKEIKEIQSEFIFGLEIKRMKMGKAKEYDLIRIPIVLYGEILTALGATPNFEVYQYSVNDESDIEINGIPLYFPSAVSNKIAKMIMQLPIDERLTLLRQFKEKADKANAQAENWMSNLDNYESYFT